MDHPYSCVIMEIIMLNLNFFHTGRMVSSLKQSGFRVTLWIHPFINTECNSFNEAANPPNMFLVRDIKVCVEINHRGPHELSFLIRGIFKVLFVIKSIHTWINKTEQTGEDPVLAITLGPGLCTSIEGGFLLLY